MLRSTRWCTTIPNKRSRKQRPSSSDAGTIDGRAPRKLSNQTHRSRTDPDATLAQKKGTPRQLKYKVHQTIDADSRVILDTEVTTGARHDNQPYLAQLAARERSATRSRFMKRPPIAAMARRQSFARCRSKQVTTLHSAVERPCGKRQVPEGRVGLRERTRSLSLPGWASI